MKLGYSKYLELVLYGNRIVPDDHITCVPNMSRIAEIDPNDTENFMVCDDYIGPAVELGLYDPESGKPFIGGMYMVMPE